MATYLAGFPDRVAVSAVNRQCSSGLQATMNIAHSIMAHQIDFGIGSGVESMSLFPMESVFDYNLLDPEVFELQGSQNCLMNMG